MKAKKILRIIAAVPVLVFMFLPADLSAGIWPWGGDKGSYRGNKNNIETVIITSNYAPSRLIANLVLSETNQPYILIPPGNEEFVYFCTPSGNTMVISNKDLEKFLWHINPKTIFILGGKNYISEKYIRMINPAQVHKAYVLSDDWNKTAEDLQKYLGTTNLLTEFKKLNKNPAPQTAPAQMPANAAQVQAVPTQSRPTAAGAPVLVKEPNKK